LPFGLTSNPFLLSAILRELATRFRDRYTIAAKLLDQCIFMDDFTASVEDDNENLAIYYELTSLLKQIRLPTAKRASNSELVKEIWRTERRELKSETGVLGVTWNTGSDSLLFDYQDITDGLKEEPATKRQVLRATAKFYDPLGILYTVSIVGKILFQDT
jgi:hypothetical protein